MTYIPDLTEREHPTRKLKTYIDDEHEEVYVGKFDEGNAMTLLQAQNDLDTAIDKYNRAVEDFENHPSAVMKFRVECASKNVKTKLQTAEIIHGEKIHDDLLKEEAVCAAMRGGINAVSF